MLKRKIFIKDKNFEVLPTSNTTANGSFAYLLQQYGVDSKLVGTGTSGLEYNIATSPLFFVRSGFLQRMIDDNNEVAILSNVSYEGNYYSSSVGRFLDSTLRMRFNFTNVILDRGWYRHIGQSLRCLYLY